MPHANVQTLLTADDAQMNKALKHGEASIQNFGQTATRVLKAVAVAFAAKVAIGWVKDLVGMADEAAAAEAKLNAVLAATGNQTGYTAEQMKALAADLQQVTKFEDDATVAAMAVLATFKQVRGEQFKDATKAAMDMATVLGGDLQGNIRTVGRALDDPIRGMMLLRRAGVSFTEAQQQMIATLQQSGNIVGAQNALLEQLEGKFGGAARAAGETFGGKVAQLKNRLGDVGEQIGAMLIPALEGAVGMIGRAAAAVEGFLPTIASWGTTIIELGGILVDWGKMLYSGWVKVSVGAVTIVQTVIENFGAIVQFVMKGAAYQVVKFGNTIAHWFTKVIPDLILWFGRNWDKVFTDIWRATSAVFSNMWTNIRDFFTAVMAWLRGEGFDFKWTGLLEGFEATLEELPKIAERIPGVLEKSLGDETAAIGAKLGKSFKENFAANMAAAGFGPAAGGAAGPGIDMTPTLGARGGGGGASAKLLQDLFGGAWQSLKGLLPAGAAKEKSDKAKEGSAGAFEGLEDLYKRIAGAAAKTPEDRTAKATEKTATNTDKMAKDIGKMAKDIGKWATQNPTAASVIAAILG